MHPVPGAVIQTELPNGRFAYRRVYRDTNLAIYDHTTDEPGRPPIGSRDFRFIVDIHEPLFDSPLVKVFDRDDFGCLEEAWPPPARVRDVMNGTYSIYEYGKRRPSSADEAAQLEPAAVWTLKHVLAGIMAL